jgi:hypothetical protein
MLERFLLNAGQQQRASVYYKKNGEFYHITTNFENAIAGGRSCLLRLYTNGNMDDTVLRGMGYGNMPYQIIDHKRNLTELANFLLDNFKMVECPTLDLLRANPDIKEYLNEKPGRRADPLVRIENGYPFIPYKDVQFWCGYYDVLRKTYVDEK